MMNYDCNLWASKPCFQMRMNGISRYHCSLHIDEKFVQVFQLKPPLCDAYCFLEKFSIKNKFFEYYYFGSNFVFHKIPFN